MNQPICKLARVVSAYAISALLLAICDQALAAPPKGSQGDSDPKSKATEPQRAEKSRPIDERELLELRQDLVSGKEARVLQALARIGEATQSAKLTSPLLDQLLRSGSNEKITLLALSTAGKLARPELSPAVAVYLKHRIPKVRATATQVLVHTGGPEAFTGLRQALRSPDPKVREHAARGLGIMGANAAVDDLVKALDRRVDTAARAIGQLCMGDQCKLLLERLGRLPLEIVTQGLEETLFRDPEEVSAKLKVQIIESVSALATAEAHDFLSGVKARWPEKQDPEVRLALDEALEFTPTR